MAQYLRNMCGWHDAVKWWYKIKMLNGGMTSSNMMLIQNGREIRLIKTTFCVSYSTVMLQVYWHNHMMAANVLAQPIKKKCYCENCNGRHWLWAGLSNGKSSTDWFILKFIQNCKWIPYLLPSILTASRETSWLSPLPSQQRRILPNRGLSSSELSSVAKTKGELPRLLVANPPDGITPPTAATPATGS